MSSGTTTGTAGNSSTNSLQKRQALANLHPHTMIRCESYNPPVTICHPYQLVVSAEATLSLIYMDIWPNVKSLVS